MNKVWVCARKTIVIPLPPNLSFDHWLTLLMNKVWVFARKIISSQLELRTFRYPFSQNKELQRNKFEALCFQTKSRTVSQIYRWYVSSNQIYRWCIPNQIYRWGISIQIFRWCISIQSIPHYSTYFKPHVQLYSNRGRTVNLSKMYYNSRTWRLQGVAV